MLRDVLLVFGWLWWCWVWSCIVWYSVCFCLGLLVVVWLWWWWLIRMGWVWWWFVFIVWLWIVLEWFGVVLVWLGFLVKVRKVSWMELFIELFVFLNNLVCRIISRRLGSSYRWYFVLVGWCRMGWVWIRLLLEEWFFLCVVIGVGLSRVECCWLYDM